MSETKDIEGHISMCLDSVRKLEALFIELSNKEGKTTEQYNAGLNDAFTSSGKDGSPVEFRLKSLTRHCGMAKFMVEDAQFINSMKPGESVPGAR